MDDVTLVYFAVATLGGLLAVLVPYWLKTNQNPSITFDIQYAYTLVVHVITQAVVLVPDSTELTLKMVLTVFAAGLGIQGVLNKAISALKKRK